MSGHRGAMFALIVSCVALVVSLGVMAYAGIRNHDRVRDIARLVDRVQASRLQGAVTACLLANAQSRTIIRFVSRVGPAYRADAVASFRVERDCVAWARREIGR